FNPPHIHLGGVMHLSSKHLSTIRFLVIVSFVVAISYRLFVASNDEMNPLAIIAHSIATIVRRFEKP
ncbi:MAG: hypothetical protein Q4F48_02875, partial [Escherichia coli]|nr:hypothetical protein [Escherichia coli]